MNLLVEQFSNIIIFHFDAYINLEDYSGKLF